MITFDLTYIFIVLQQIVAPLTAEELHKQTNKESNQVEAVAIKLRKSGINKNRTIIAKRKGKKNKEVIDYSATQKDAEPNTVPGAIPIVAEADSVGKVQNWLLNTPRPAIITKSKSTPVGLTDKTFAVGNKVINSSKIKRHKPERSNSKSVNNLSQSEKDKVRLQVIYKPPFKFSLKLCKGDKTRVVLDKTAHTRPDQSKKKSHVRLNKTISNSVVPVNDIINSQNSQITHVSNTATVGLSNVPESSFYEQINSSLVLPPNEERNQHHKPTKWNHKKSNSVGQSNQMVDSRQNLLIPDQSSDNNLHFYENLMATDSMESVDNHKKTHSMPRNSSLQRPIHISRQNSSNAAIPARMSSQRIIQRNGLIKKSLSNASQQNSSKHLQKGSSLNNLNLDIEKKRNSLSQKKRNSMATEHVYSNTMSDEKPKRLLKLSDGSRNHLKRQTSATELYKGSPHMDFFMPMSAGANYVDACRPEFEWIQSTDNQVPLTINDSRTSRDCLESQIVPNISNVMPLERSSNLPASNAPFLKRQDDPACTDIANQWPQKFGDLKHSLPDSSQVDAAAYLSDMEVLVSDNDHSLYNV